jgi:hypothetical protein
MDLQERPEGSYAGLSGSPGFLPLLFGACSEDNIFVTTVFVNLLLGANNEFVSRFGQVAHEPGAGFSKAFTTEKHFHDGSIRLLPLR